MVNFTDHFACSDKYQREINQDCCFSITTETTPPSEHKMSIQCVLDGVSGSDDGCEASRLAMSVMHAPLSKLIGGVYALSEMDMRSRQNRIYSVMREAVMTADSVLRSNAMKLETTVSIAVVFDEYLYTCNVGDSPIYLIEFGQVKNTIKEKFVCHNEAGKRVREGMMTKEEALVACEKNYLLSSVGSSQMLQEHEISTGCTELVHQNNILLLGSDGALAAFAEERLLELAEAEPDNMKSLCQRIFMEVDGTDSTDNFTLMATKISLN